MDAIDTLLLAIKRIKEPRFFSSERGYQGQLVSELDRLLGDSADITRPLVEQEYQKRAKVHGITFRPDIIVHVPFERGVSPSRRHDNYLVIMLKLSAKEKKANEDFAKLSAICSALEYPLGALVNVASADLWLPHYPRKGGEKFNLHEFAIMLHDGCLDIRKSQA